jgi:hypothetical protein
MAVWAFGVEDQSSIGLFVGVLSFPSSSYWPEAFKVSQTKYQENFVFVR